MDIVSSLIWRHLSISYREINGTRNLMKLDLNFFIAEENKMSGMHFLSDEDHKSSRRLVEFESNVTSDLRRRS